MYYQNRILVTLTFVLLLPIASHQAQAIPVSVNCDDRSFVVNFENVSTPITKTISVSGPIKTCELKEVRSAPGWNKGKGCKFTFSKTGSLSGVHRGVFGGKLECGNGSGSGGGSSVTWTGSASFCPGGISNIENKQDLNNCPRSNRVKSEGIGPPGSETPVDGCSFWSIANELAVFWESRNVIASAPDTGRLLAGGQGPNSGLPCDEHDVCYRKCGADKGSCDNQIVAGIVSQCNNYDEGWQEIAEQRNEENLIQITPEQLRRQCVSSASAVEAGVESFKGQEAYDNRQIERCSCCGNQ